eukprot:365813-Chlamydomonas_euryale.AAC.11
MFHGSQRRTSVAPTAWMTPALGSPSMLVSPARRPGDARGGRVPAVLRLTDAPLVLALPFRSACKSTATTKTHRRSRTDR